MNFQQINCENIYRQKLVLRITIAEMRQINVSNFLTQILHQVTMMILNQAVKHHRKAQVFINFKKKLYNGVVVTC